MVWPHLLHRILLWKSAIGCVLVSVGVSDDFVELSSDGFVLDEFDGSKVAAGVYQVVAGGLVDLSGEFQRGHAQADLFGCDRGFEEDGPDGCDAAEVVYRMPVGVLPGAVDQLVGFVEDAHRRCRSTQPRASQAAEKATMMASRAPSSWIQFMIRMVW